MSKPLDKLIIVKCPYCGSIEIVNDTCLWCHSQNLSEAVFNMLWEDDEDDAD